MWMGKLEGKIAVVTGGSSGLGLATAQRLVAEGARVFVTGRRKSELEAAAKLIGEHAVAVQGDVANLADLDRLYATVREKSGRIDVLFANAGMGTLRPLGAITEENFDTMFDINVKGLVFTVQKALPLLQDGSSIILNASSAASSGAEGFSIYGATKAAVRSFARIPTPGYTNAGLVGEVLEQFKAHMIQGIPMGRVGEADEVAKAVVFLASDESSYITGIDLAVDGGMTQV
jgi:NAD(P)-dependent dehydrogenase (short-subunit alcohol dehydrogenase family)